MSVRNGPLAAFSAIPNMIHNQFLRPCLGKRGLEVRAKRSGARFRRLDAA